MTDQPTVHSSEYHSHESLEEVRARIIGSDSKQESVIIYSFLEESCREHRAIESLDNRSCLPGSHISCMPENACFSEIKMVSCTDRIPVYNNINLLVHS